MRLHGIMVVLVKTKYSVEDDEYDYHDSLRTRHIEGTEHQFVVK